MNCICKKSVHVSNFSQIVRLYVNGIFILNTDPFVPDFVYFDHRNALNYTAIDTSDFTYIKCLKDWFLLPEKSFNCYTCDKQVFNFKMLHDVAKIYIYSNDRCLDLSQYFLDLYENIKSSVGA